MKFQNKKIANGSMLIALGAAILLIQNMDNMSEGIPFIIIGGIFLVIYFLKEKSGFLIPGCILSGIGIGAIGDDYIRWMGDFEVVGLGLGFMAIYFIQKVHDKKSHWWPLIPGVILIGNGLADSHGVIRNFWPAILIIIGVYLLVKNKDDDKDPTDFTKPLNKP